MAFIKGVVFNNRQSFEGFESAVFNFYKAKYPNSLATKWSEGIDALDGSNNVLMLIDERVLDFNWNPHSIQDIDVNDAKWFNYEI